MGNQIRNPKLPSLNIKTLTILNIICAAVMVFVVIYAAYSDTSSSKEVTNLIASGYTIIADGNTVTRIQQPNLYKLTLDDENKVAYFNSTSK